MSETPVRKAPVTTDPASAPPHPQQRQDQVQDPRQEQRQDARQEQRQDQPPAQRSAQSPTQQPGQSAPQHLAQDQARESNRESTRESGRESARETSAREASARESVQESSRDTSQRPVGRLEDEWQAVQYEFVDDPKSAVRKADDLVQRAIQELTTRHRTLSQQWQGEGKHETEDLRLALHRYRELFKSLVAVK